MENKQCFTFGVSNPMLAAALTPLFGITVPIFSMLLPRLSDSFRIALILVYFVASIIILYTIVKTALQIKKVTVHSSEIEIGKNKYAQSEISKIEINRNTRYMSIKLEQRWGSNSYHIKDKKEIESVIAGFEKWIEGKNISFNVKQ
jgi:uncharacterized membrane protein